MNVGEYIKELRKEKDISQRQLSEMSGISNAEISRIETGERQKPSPDVLRKLAPHLGVSNEELMDIAGYINERSAFILENKEAEQRFISIITPKLIMAGWGIEPIQKSSYLGDIIARKDSIEWHIDFKYFKTRDDDDKNFREESRAKDTATRLYGRLAIYDKSPITKFSIAVNDEKTFYYMQNFPPIHLNIEVTLLLVNLEEGNYIEHEFWPYR